MKTILVLIDLASIDYVLVPVIEEFRKSDSVRVVPLVYNYGKSDLLLSKGLPFTTNINVINKFLQTPGKKLFLNAADMNYPAHRLGWSIDDVCRRNSIPSLSVEHSAHSLTGLGQGSIVNADCIALAGAEEYEVYRSLGVSPEKLIITGSPKYDSYYGLFKETTIQNHQNIPDFTNKGGYILFAGVNNGFVDFPFASGIPAEQWIGVLRNIFEFLIDNFHLNIVVKPHPAEPELGVDKLYEEAISPENKTKIQVINPHDSLHNAILGSELVISFSPTVMLESLLFHKPVICFQHPNMSDSISKLCEGSGAIFVRREWFDIKNSLKEDIPQGYFRRSHENFIFQ